MDQEGNVLGTQSHPVALTPGTLTWPPSQVQHSKVSEIGSDLGVRKKARAVVLKEPSYLPNGANVVAC